MSQALEKTLEIAGIGIVGVFLFMTLFYLLILALDKIFPEKEGVNTKEDSVKEKIGDET
jgi:Na+-transporting methylmalonyl-CoA/oxaloacetate decarboxylase gamma subunit